MIDRIHGVYFGAKVPQGPYGSSMTPYMFTYSIGGLGGRNVLAETALSKVSLGQPVGYARAFILAWVYTFSPPDQMYEMPRQIVEFDLNSDSAPPIRYIPNAVRVTFAIEVRLGYAYATGKLYFYS